MNYKYSGKLTAQLFASFLVMCPIWVQAQATTIVDSYTQGDNGANGITGPYLGMGSLINVGNALVPAITSLDFVMNINAGNPAVAPAPTVRVCPDAAGTPDMPGCVNFTYTGTTAPLDPSGTVWAGNVYKNSYSGNFPISPQQNVWVLATADTPKSWLITNWAGTFGGYQMVVVSDPGQPTTWTPSNQSGLGIPVSLYYTAAVVVTPEPDSGSGVAGTPITPINVLANDSTDGMPSTLANSTITVVTPASNSGVVLDPATGLVITTAGVPPGIYGITYQLCSKAMPAVCANTTVTIAVSAQGNPASIPTLSEFGLMLLGSLLMVFGLPHLRRREH